MPNSNQWLNSFRRDVTSGAGEDGIIEKIFEIIKNPDHWCVEFGAGDGQTLSNTFSLIKDKGYSAVLIEPSGNKFKKLQEVYKDKENVIVLKEFVGFTDEDSLDKILKKTPIPINFDLLSIDIDGNDYHIWKATKRYQPKVVIIEYNITIPNSVEFVQAQDLRINQGSSILSICKLAKQKGYELVATTWASAFFVHEKYFPAFGITDNSLQQLRSNEAAITYIFSGFDGTIFLRGARKLWWHHIPYDESRVQQLPKFLRCFPPNYGKFKMVIAGLYFFIFRHHPLPNKKFLSKAISKLLNR